MAIRSLKVVINGPDATAGSTPSLCKVNGIKDPVSEAIDADKNIARPTAPPVLSERIRVGVAPEK